MFIIMRSYSHQDNLKQELDLKLDKLWHHMKNGFYIELGANDGLTQSNTAFFEFFRNWTGILIEPSMNAYQKCVKNRPNSTCLNYACVSNDYSDETIAGDFNGNLMSSVNGQRLCNNNLISVPSITLENVLDQYKQSEPIDFLSLDTEGYELEILKGLNLNKYRPRYMLIEVYLKDYHELVAYLKRKNYRLHSNFSNYNKTNNPGWDGTHNDYLFIDELISSVGEKSN